MNLKKIFTHGLIAGLIILIIGAGLVPIIGHEMNNVLASRLLPPLSGGAMVFFLFVSLFNGIALIGLYALIRNYFQSTLRAALVTSTIIWFFNYLIHSGALVAYGFMPLQISIIGTSWGILEVFTAGIIVSRLYDRKRKNT